MSIARNHTPWPLGPKPKKFITLPRVIVYGVLILCCLFFLFPLYIMIITSLKDLDAIREGNLFTPSSNLTISPWVKAWSQACTGLYCEGIKAGLHQLAARSQCLRVIVSIAVACITGYSLANWPFKYSETFFTILLLASFIPYVVMIYPIVIITRWLGIFSTLPAVVLVHTIFGLPLLTLLFRNYFASLPQELFKAARVDGAGYWRILFQVFLPMAVPIMTVAVILQVTGIWNDFLFGVIYAGPTNYPMTVQLNNIVNTGQGVKEYNVDMAATILTGIVPLAIYFFSGKYFVRGIAAGAVKG